MGSRPCSPRPGIGGSVGAYQEQFLKQDLVPVAIRKLPPWLFATASSRNLIAVAAITIPAVTAGIFTPIVDFKIDPGKNGVIKWFANQYVGGGFTDGSGAIIWRLAIDGVAVPGFENISVSLGTNQIPSEIAPVRLFAGRRVQLLVTNASIVPAGQIIEGGIRGWLYPKDEEAPAPLY
jgi:hypothetical protein